MILWDGTPRRFRIRLGSEASGSAAFEPMSKASHFRNLHHGTPFRWLNGSGSRGIFGQRQVSAGPEVVSEIQFECPVQRLLVEYEEVIKALPPKGSDQALDIGTLPWRSRRLQDFPHTHPSHSLPKDVAIDAIAVMEQIAWGRVPREGLGHLLRRPSRGGVGGNVEMNHSTPMMGQNYEDEQDSKAQGRHHEDVGRDGFLHVIVEIKSTRPERAAFAGEPYASRP